MLLFLAGLIIGANIGFWIAAMIIASADKKEEDE